MYINSPKTSIKRQSFPDSLSHITTPPLITTFTNSSDTRQTTLTMHLSLTSLTLLALPLLSQGAPLPSTLIISVLEASTGALLGTLTGHGTLSSPGPAYPYRSNPVSSGSDVSTIQSYGPPGCSAATGILSCDPGTSDPSLFIVSSTFPSVIFVPFW
jgi:hypothetical protein